VDNPGCDSDHWHPTGPTKEYKVCADSNQAMIKSFQNHFFSHFRDFPTEQLNIGDANKDTCIKFTLNSQGTMKKI
jgi:hypothetical protein